MFIDTLLFYIGGLLAFITLTIIIYLVISFKRSKVYKDVLQQETDFYNTLATTSRLEENAATSPASINTQDMRHAETSLTASESPGGLAHDYVLTDLSCENEPADIDFDASALEGRYILRREIQGGGMSRVFLADSIKLGNQWIVKFISNKYVQLLNEENILKLLNHISLPKIIDIFKDSKGVYLVESFIEGVTLDNVLKSGFMPNQVIIQDWAEQLAQALNYLHTLKPHPIHHYDLKPSNIMVTHDNRLVIIDFGVSKQFGENEEGAASIGITYKYAAPEQIKHPVAQQYQSLISQRFGELPAAKNAWRPDARTDIYSLGAIMFELATGKTPTLKNQAVIKSAVSREMQEIINKCLSIDPAQRFQTATELLTALQKSKGTKIKMIRTLFIRKMASVSCVLSMLASGGSITGGYYIWGQENAATLDAKPEIMTISLQQSSELTVVKHMPGGNAATLENSQIRWSFSRDNIARVDGNRISGINVGETVLSGQYRNKTIALDVRVVEPIDAIVDISLRYQPGRAICVYAGTTEREHNDGALEAAEFVSPESIAVSENGTIYIVDSGLLRRINGDDQAVDSINFNPDYLSPKIVRCCADDVYVLTHEWETDDGMYYGVIKLTEGGAEGLYMADAKFSAVEDFAFCPEGMLYFIDRNAGLNGVFLKTIDPANLDDIRTLCELPKGTASLTIDGRGVVYLANPESGAIQVWQNDALSYFSGVENEKAFIDGNAPLYYMPLKIKYMDDSLFVWDFNVLRRLHFAGSAAAECMTIAGEASPVFDLDVAQREQAAEAIVLPNSALTDFIIADGRALITDPKHGLIWQVDY